MYEDKKDTNFLLVLFTSIIYVFIAIFIIFFIGLSKVDAASYKFSNPSLHRICEGSIAAGQSGDCITNNYSNEVWANDQPGYWLQVAYRTNTNNNGVSGTTYQPGNYSIAFSGFLHVEKNSLILNDRIELNLLYYPTSTNTYGKATCDSGEIFRIQEINTAALKYYYYTYSCETLTITEGKSFIGYEIVVPGANALGVVKPVIIGNIMENNLVIGGPSDTQDIINNFNQNFNDLILSQNQNTQQIIDSVTNPDISGSNDTIGGFFGSFSDTDHGGLSGIITAPLIAFNQMLTGTCTDLSVEYKGSTTILPCGTSFWNQISPIRDFLNITLGGLICYQIVRKLFLLIQKIKNPDDDRVEVMSL